MLNLATPDCSSPLQAAFAAHRRAALASQADPENDALGDAMLAAEAAVVDARCANVAEFIEKLDYLLRALREQCGREPGGDDFEPIACAVAFYMSQREQAAPRRARAGYEEDCGCRRQGPIEHRKERV